MATMVQTSHVTGPSFRHWYRRVAALTDGSANPKDRVATARRGVTATSTATLSSTLTLPLRFGLGAGYGL
jgi:hypothetical protein